ncbi:MAG: DUF448 domain-containing protein [Actinobacteria bacterium]|nr:DUF448 domain-containing protein [Actinomycetota bacterium]MSW14960.1 DUF448 domain-containing protein [Actinomycetota bacterium]MSW98502.1 DUF448 domain-containing protein [Actinomycetota bacterium]MSY82393.1 DUF448 domain-containing protein [Actinomycetota bacterium]MSZ45464.1 DUF448 domain-containing protein [Actinomycetota bacterium]
MIPIRSCIACRKRENKTDLLRVVREGDRVVADSNNRKVGRGAWLHRRCFDTAVQRKSFERALKSESPLNLDSLKDFLAQK